jgi:hypothetical protein
MVHTDYFKDLVQKRNFVFGAVKLKGSGDLNYVISPAHEKAFLILHIHDNNGRTIATHVGTKEEVRALGKDNLSLTDYPSYSSAFKTRSKKCDARKMRSRLELLSVREDDNSVQTRKEAEIAGNPALIKQIQEIYNPGFSCRDLDLSKFNSVVMVANVPILACSYYCAGGQQILYNSVIWSENRVYILYPVITEIFRKSMHENVQKSSKMSLDPGLSLSSPAPVFSYAPEAGDPVFSNGKPRTDSDGRQVKFNPDDCRTWAKLRIGAELRMMETGSVECVSYDIAK